MFCEGVLIADRYKLVSLLGRGGFSEVWLAEDVLANIKAAIKIYAPGVGLDDAGITLFTQEFSLVFDMNHTNLLHPTHFDCWQRMPFLILPYCQNGSAFKYVSPGNQISEEEAWKVLHDVASGLAYLHGKNPPVIHQDIKPDNILISDEGRYMITDFGISARIRSTLNRSAAEMSGGTLAYMGPERFGQSPQPIMASDIWSLGAMMYEMMTGYPPYNNHGGMLQKNGADIPLIEGNYSQKLKDLIYRCVALNTWDRPTAEQIERETSEYLLGKTTMGSSVITPPMTQGLNKSKGEVETSPRKDYKKWGILGVILAVVVIVASLLFGGGEPEIEPDPNPIDFVKEQDSIACERHLLEAERILESVAHMMDPIVYDSDSIQLEDKLIPAYKEYSKALDMIKVKGMSIDSLSIISQMKSIEQILDLLETFCDERIKMFENDTDMKDFVEKFIERKQKINLINYNDNEN